MKHVWILNHYAIEPGGAGGTRHFHLARNLVNFGWEATILAASVELNSGRQRLSPSERFRLDKKEGVHFLWIRTPKYKGNGIRRIVNMFSYTYRVLLPSHTMQLPKPHIIIGSSVHPFAALSGLLLARRHRVPFVFEVRDLWPQTLIDMGRIRERSVATWLLRRVELWLYHQAYRIVVLLPRAVDYIAPLGISSEKVVWIPNGVEIASFSEDPPQRDKDESFILMYFGAHGQANGLDNILRAMKIVSERVPNERIKLRMIGDGPLKPQLLRLSEKLNLKNVSFEPPVPKNVIPTLAVEADAFIIALLDLPHLYQYGISMNKIFDYLAAGRPTIIASSAVNNPIKESGSGITVEPNDPGALAKAIILLSHMTKEKRLHMGYAGRRFVEEKHSFDRLAGLLALTLNECLEESQQKLRFKTRQDPFRRRHVSSKKNYEDT